MTGGPMLGPKLRSKPFRPFGVTNVPMLRFLPNPTETMGAGWRGAPIVKSSLIPAPKYGGVVPRNSGTDGTFTASFLRVGV